MTATPEQIGPYTVESEIGRGGMGVVYLATDSRLDRKVAIKALPEHFAMDPERLARFEREARTLAALNHPNVAGIHGVEEHEGRRYLVLEYIEGETLADRLDRGPLPVDEATDVCAQIAAGLEAAHEAGVIHRDLKPANIRITPEGKAKVLDFGLARAEETSSSGSSVSQMPTLATPMSPHSPTTPGAILGTAPYMSPEQARGRKVDKRSDIWSFGVVLYECLTGVSPFVGETATDSIGAILHKDVDLDRLPPSTTENVRRVLDRCLRRDRNERWRDIGDARLELLTPSKISERASATAGGRAGLAWTVAAVCLLVALGSLAIGLTPSTERAPAIYAQFAAPDGGQFVYNAGPPAVSPDGTQVAFVAADDAGERHLYVRSLHEPGARRLDGTVDAAWPFWSPDSRSIAYVDGSHLRRIDADGGMSDIICEAEGAYGGGDWNADGIIIFATPFGSTFRRQGGIGWVPASGGRPTPATEIDAATNEFWHVSPTFLPDGERFLFSTRRGIGGENGVAVGSIKGGPHRRVLDVTSNAVYVEPGYVLYWRDGALRGQRFDAKTATPTGDPFVVAAQTRFEPDSLAAMFGVSESGVLVFHPGQSATAKSRLELRDRTGAVVGTVGADGNYYAPRFSYDGAFVAVDSSDVNNNGDIWIYGVTSPAAVRLTFDLADESRPTWSPDGQRVAFLTGKNGLDDIHAKHLRNPAIVDVILEDDRFTLEPTDWSPNGSIIAANRSIGDRSDGGDIILIDVESRSVEPFTESPFMTEDLRFSPDGEWCLYMSNETGQRNVYLQKLDDPLQRTLVSLHGGNAPRWRSDGRELFYRSLDDQLMSVALPEGPGGPVGTPQALFHLNGRFSAADDFDVAPDGQTIVVNTLIRENSTAPMTVVINWLAGVDAK